MAAIHTRASDTQQSSSSRQVSNVLLAALPHLLMSTTYFGVSVAFGGSGMSWYPYFLVVLLAAAGFLAWRRGWPLWSGSWAGYWLVATILLLGEVAGSQWGQWTEILILLVAAGTCAILALRRPLYALLTSLPLLILFPRLFFFEHVAGGHWISGGVFVLLALTAAVIVWLGSVRATLLLAILVHVVTGLAFTLGKFYLPYRFAEMEPRETPAFTEVVNEFVPLTVAIIANSVTLFLLNLLWRFSMRERNRNLIILPGACLASMVAIWGLRSERWLLSRELLTALLLGGLLLSFGAALPLVRDMRKRDVPPKARLAPILVMFAPLLLFPLATPFAQVGAYTDATQFWIGLSYAGAVLWLTIATWLILTLAGARKAASNGR